MNVEILGNHLEQRLAFSLTKPLFNVEQFGFIALGIAMKTIIKGLEEIHIIPHFLVAKIDSFYAKEKAHINGIINRAVAENAITGKPGVHAGGSATAAIAAMKAQRVAQTATSQANAEDRLKALEAAHKADYDKFCSIQTTDPRVKRPVFDPCFYLNKYPDLAKAFGANFALAAGHWRDSGTGEGRQSAPGFSLMDYVLRYQDLANAFSNQGGAYDNVAVLKHWVDHGSKEGRNPGPLECGKTGGAKGAVNVIFDPCFYVNKYPDLKAAFGTSRRQALAHWYFHGKKEGRQSSATFAVADYIMRYPDLVAAFAGPGAPRPRYVAALKHWFDNGKKEGRNPKPFAACGTSGGVRELAGQVFDPCFYLNKYPDLKKKFGNDTAKAFSHWIGSGLKNGRQSNASFDINAYVVRYQDLENVFIDTKTGAVSYICHDPLEEPRQKRRPQPEALCSLSVVGRHC